ncbi:hypothetical protein MUG78_04935 [Gordonia alkaliphila]|uniref:Transmembrane protein n=1 Tax=Gordonia alkaliphila TaxID=1053547 RepID=A0ABP8ZAX5_9ACTN|nr:hypothetical protein [Gordonia alkaliphila]MCK0438826.1 hypothetical protein [Gordonia alkaliphila]
MSDRSGSAALPVRPALPAAVTSLILTGAICAPLFGGYLLHRDAVAVPRTPLTAAALGIDGAPPRAVPQDGVLAVASQVVDGGFLVAAVIALALFAAGLGAGLLAQRLLPWAGTAGAVAATGVAIWNPFVAERLLQGHWSLLTGYAALPWIVLAVQELLRPARWAVLAGLLAVAGFTPTGSLLGLVVAAVALAATALARRPLAWLGLLGLWLVTALPWLVASTYSTGATDPVDGAAAFAARAEPLLGTLGSVLGLGGIWNADAVPVSRTSGWAAVATVALLVVVIIGGVELWRRRRALPRTVLALGLLAVAVAVLTACAATGPGLAVVDVLLAHVPGAGLLRDTQKFLALAIPFYALAAAAAVGALRRWVPAGVAVAGVALLVIAPLPDLAWGVGGELAPVEYPDDYARVTALIGDDHRAVLLVPTSPMRDFAWNNAPSLTPLPRMLDAPVLVDDTLLVDGIAVDAAPRSAPGRPEDLVGVGWIVRETPPHAEFAPPPGAQLAFAGEHLTAYRLPDAVPFRAPSTTAWVLAGLAHTVWFLCLVAGLLSALGARARRRPARS